jgi:hypothetical protein
MSRASVGYRAVSVRAGTDGLRGQCEGNAPAWDLQRIQAVLYHHGCSHRRQLIVDDGRERLDAQPLPETARCGLALSLWSDHLDASGLRLGCAFQPLI